MAKMMGNTRKIKSSKAYIKEVNKSTRALFKDVRDEITGGKFSAAKATMDSMKAEAKMQKRGFYSTAIRKAFNDSNLVRLTAREHFICHLLLPKMTVSPLKYQMAAAIARMIGICKDHQRSYTSSMYETAKKIMSSARKGITFTQEHKEKLTESNRRNARYGKDNSSTRQSVKDKISNFNRKSVRVSKGLEPAFYISRTELDDYLLLGYTIWGCPSTKGFKWYKSPCETKQVFCDPKNAPGGWIPGRLYKKRSSL
jgi:hypothetical protein